MDPQSQRDASLKSWLRPRFLGVLSTPAVHFLGAVPQMLAEA
jgi:hypothetical protein